MPENMFDCNEPIPSPQPGGLALRRIFDRRHFLGAAAAGLAVAAGGHAWSAEPQGPRRAPAAPDENASLNVRWFGARGDGTTDDTAAIQKALDAAGRQRGNVVLLPTGDYRVDGALRVPEGVTLQGVFRAPHRGASRQTAAPCGSRLLAVGGKGKPDGPALISLHGNSALCGLTVFYPEQTCPAPPVEYPWTVRQMASDVAVMNVLLLNPWRAVDCGTVTGGRHYIHGLYAQPLKTGLFIDQCYDIGRVQDVHFWPFWKINPKLQLYTSTEATAFLIGRTDWEYMFNCFAIFHQTGYHFVPTPSGQPNALLTQCGSDEGAPGARSISVRVDASQPYTGISFLNGQFFGAPAVRVTAGNSGPVKFTNCSFWGGPRTDAMAVLEGSGQTTFIGSHFRWTQRGGKARTILARRGGLTVEGCEFMDSGGCQVALEGGVAAAVISGNRFHGPARIRNQIGKKAQIGLNAFS